MLGGGCLICMRVLLYFSLVRDGNSRIAHHQLVIYCHAQCMQHMCSMVPTPSFHLSFIITFACSGKPSSLASASFTWWARSCDRRLSQGGCSLCRPWGLCKRAALTGPRTRTVSARD